MTAIPQSVGGEEELPLPQKQNGAVRKCKVTKADPIDTLIRNNCEMIKHDEIKRNML